MEKPKFKIWTGTTLVITNKGEAEVFSGMEFEIKIPGYFGSEWSIEHIIEPIEQAIRNEIQNLSQTLNIEFEEGIED